MPLTDYELTQTTLLVESRPLLGDFRPLDFSPGTLAAFHGTLCRHFANANPTQYTRASLDFRIGIGRFFDSNWTLRGTKSDHGRFVVECSSGDSAAREVSGGDVQELPLSPSEDAAPLRSPSQAEERE